MAILLQDLRYAVRMLWKSPGFTAVAVLSLALGIGANTAMFTVINAVLVRPLPYKDPGRLVELHEYHNDRELRNFIASSRGYYSVNPASFLAWRDQNDVFENIAAIQVVPFGFTLAGFERIEAHRVSASFFSILGVKPLLGRTFLTEEDTPDGESVVVLSHRLWRRRFGSDPEIIGKTAKLETSLQNKTYRIVGVMPPEFRFYGGSTINRGSSASTEIEAWVPFPFLNTPHPATNFSNRDLHVVARLKPAVALEQAQTEMRAIAQRIEQQFPATNTGWGVLVSPMNELLVKESRAPLFLLLGAVGFVLLIACSNVANLLLIRTATRQREIAIAAALGASRLRLLRQFLTESVLLALLGGAAGLALAAWGSDVLGALSSGSMPRLDERGIDFRVFGFTLLLSLLSALLFGLAPALRGSNGNVSEMLKTTGRSATGSFSRSRLGGILVIGQVALTLILLIGTGLMINSFVRLQGINPGFDTHKVLAIRVALQPSKFFERSILQENSKRRGQGVPGTAGGLTVWSIKPELAGFVQRVVQRLESLPGVESAAVVNRTINNTLPFGGIGYQQEFRIEGRTLIGANSKPVRPDVACRHVSSEYFRTMGIRLLQGRPFTDRDAHDAPTVVIINEAMARRYWPQGNPIGSHIWSRENGTIDAERAFEVVGLAADIRQEPDHPAKPEMYIPFVQHDQDYVFFTARGGGVIFLVRTVTDPTSMAAAVGSTIRQVDPDQPVESIETMDQYVASALAPWRRLMLLLGIFGGLALTLSTVGIYGVISYGVAQRTQELGIRMALSAQARDVRRLVIGQGLSLTFTGLAIGAVGAYWLTRLISNQLFGVTPTDPVTFSTVALLLTAVALLASFIPARRATKIDPIVALRQD